MEKWNEIIVVVPRVDLFNNEKLVFQGSLEQNGDRHDKGTAIIENMMKHYATMRRGNEKDPTPAENNAEINLAFKQPITYTVIRRGDKVFLYKRLTGGGESRLHDKLSIGVGGHMNDLPEEEKSLMGDSFNFQTLLSDNMERELIEELFIDGSDRETEIIALINDDTDEVGKFHIGILAVLDVGADVEVEVNEPDQLSGEWISLQELLKPEIFNKLENWSKIAAKAL